VAALDEAPLGGPAEEAAVRWVTETARGNPVYVQELVADAAVSRALAQGDGLWQLVGRPGVGATLRERRPAHVPPSAGRTAPRRLHQRTERSPRADR
jgi:CTP:molybdopterin cytidylyltransferase MocA